MENLLESKGVFDEAATLVCIYYDQGASSDHIRRASKLYNAFK